MERIRLERLTKIYDRHPVVVDFSLSVPTRPPAELLRLATMYINRHLQSPGIIAAAPATPGRGKVDQPLGLAFAVPVHEAAWPRSAPRSPQSTGRESSPLSAVPPELLAMNNVVLLPHLGSATSETRRAMGDLCRANLDSWFAGDGVKTVIPELRALRPVTRSATRR